ncbi:MAG: ATP-binding protein [Desulfobacteraceae bacterium]|nr:ATP-binding protein [Desulfobacteraceae bacterium]
MTENINIEPLEDFIGDLFVNRDEEFRLCRKWADNIPKRHANSWALVGRRRTGKTAILVKFFNKLFHEQDRIIPVFITFAHYVNHRKPITYYDFADEFFGGYLRCHLAFRYRMPMLVRDNADIQTAMGVAEEVNDAYALEIYRNYERLRLQEHMAAAHSLAQWVINFPKGHAATRNMPAAIIVDEFQVLTNVYDPIQKVHHDLTDSFQRAAETLWAPLLLSGSAVTLLEEEALGGLLAGRVDSWHLKPLSREYTHDLVFRFAERFNIKADEAFAEAIFRMTGGYPYSVEKLFFSKSPWVSEYPSLDALEKVMNFELGDARGALYKHYNWEFRKYSKLLNAGQTTRKVMFWTTKYPEKRIEAEDVAREIGESFENVQASLEKLLQADIVTRASWTLYNGPGDPMLRRYIEYNYCLEIEKLSPAEAAKDWHNEYRQLRGQMNNFIGETAEVYVEAVMRGFDGREVDGPTYFNTSGSVKLPKFTNIERRGGIVDKGIPVEIDLTGERTDAGSDDTVVQSAWIVQVKYTKDPIGPDDIRKFLDQADKIIEKKAYASVTCWYFSKKGYTKAASECLRQAGVLFSTLEQFNALAKLVGFFGLPE